MGCVPPKPSPRIDWKEFFSLENGAIITLPQGYDITSIKTEIKRCAYCGGARDYLDKESCRGCGAPS